MSLTAKAHFLWRSLYFHRALPRRLAVAHGEILASLKAGELAQAARLLNDCFAFLATNTRFGSIRPEPARRPLVLKQRICTEAPLMFIASHDGRTICYEGDFSGQSQPWMITRLTAFHRIFEAKAIRAGPFEPTRFHLGDCYDGPFEAATPSSRGRRPILVPDADFITSRGYEAVEKLSRYHAGPWEKRKRVIFWRGGVNCQDEHLDCWRSNPRLRLCLMVRAAPLKLPCDVAVVNGAWGVDQIYGEGAAMKEIQEAGVIGNQVLLKNFAEYQFSFDIDGYSNAWSSLFTKLLMGLVVFKIQSQNGYRQWYYDRLVPFKHYIPVASDLSDLQARVEWASEHHEACAAISRSAWAVSREIRYSTEIAAAAARI